MIADLVGGLDFLALGIRSLGRFNAGSVFLDEGCGFLISQGLGAVRVDQQHAEGFQLGGRHRDRNFGAVVLTFHRQVPHLAAHLHAALGIFGCVDVQRGNAMIQGDLATAVTGRDSVVVATIVADAIILLSKDASRFMAEDGVYIVSGIIDTREQDVLTALDACGLTVTERMESGGWLCLVCKR